MTEKNDPKFGSQKMIEVCEHNVDLSECSICVPARPASVDELEDS